MYEGKREREREEKYGVCVCAKEKEKDVESKLLNVMLCFAVTLLLSRFFIYSDVELRNAFESLLVTVEELR